MALPLRPRAAPQCSACLRNYAFGARADAVAAWNGFRQQVRGKKKMPNNSATVTVKLLRDVKAYGRRGAIVPVARGDMRNTWFPQRTARYVTVPQMKTLRLNKVAMERDYNFDTTVTATEAATEGGTLGDVSGDIISMSNQELRSASGFQTAAEVQRLTPERSRELVDIFIPPRLDFYRQPIMEDKVAEEPEPEPERPQFGGVAGELMAARTRAPKKSKEAPQAIYGSVSVSDVLVALRAAMGTNDEASRVVLAEDDLHFVNLPDVEGAEAGRVKHIGEFAMEIKIRGMEAVVTRMVKVVPQEM